MIVNVFPVEILPTLKYFTSWELIRGLYFFIEDTQYQNTLYLVEEEL